MDRCANCNERDRLTYCHSADEYWCGSCLSNLAETEGQRVKEDFQSGPPGFASLLGEPQPEAGAY